MRGLKKQFFLHAGKFDRVNPVAYLYYISVYLNYTKIDFRIISIGEG